MSGHPEMETGAGRALPNDRRKRHLQLAGICCAVTRRIPLKAENYGVSFLREAIHFADEIGRTRGARNVRVLPVRRTITLKRATKRIGKL